MPPALSGPVDRIVVFRALRLGGLLCAGPALRALRAGFPHARITLVGLPWAAELAERLSSVDDFIAFPGPPSLPERDHDPHAWPRFIAQVRQQRFDLAVQLHGSGASTNWLVANFGARRNAGFASSEAWRPKDDVALFPAWPESGSEIERLLRLTDHLGLARRGTHLEFPLRNDDRIALWDIWQGADEGIRYVCVHAGAQLSSRRWGAQRFAAVADAVAARGLTVVLTGTESERELVAEVSACMRHTAVNLCGQTTLWTLGALIESCDAVICNDTGIAHIAAALRRPSVVIGGGSDTQRWAPLDRTRHRVVADQVACQVCQRGACPSDHDCATGTAVRQVLAAYGGSPASRPRSTLAVDSSSLARFS